MEQGAGLPVLRSSKSLALGEREFTIDFMKTH
jgi:hypothetical protein